MKALVPLPILIALATAIVTVFLGRSFRGKVLVSLVGGGATFATALLLLWTVWTRGPVVHAMGSWPPPFGIILVADLLSSGIVLLASGVAMVALCYSVGYVEEEGQRLAYHPLFHLLMMGIYGAFLTGDIFNLFVFFEILLISSYALVAFAGEDYQLEAALKYATINLIASAAFLLAVGGLYGVMGTLNMADLSLKIRQLHDSGPLPTIFLLFVAVFGVKASIFPFYFWLPDAHSSAPTPISAMLSGILIKVGAYSILRVSSVIFVPLWPDVQTWILTLAAVTMVVGACGAVAQSDVKRLLAYSSVGQMGYIMLGLGIGTPLALVSTLLFIVNHALAKAMLFLMAGVVIEATGTRDMGGMGGLARQMPWTAGAFLVGAMAIAGVPPLFGFFAKFLLITAAIEAGYGFLAALAAGLAIVTLWYLFAAWQQIFWREGNGHELHAASRLMKGPGFVLAGVIVVGTICLNPVVNFLRDVEAQMRQPANYVTAVFHEVSHLRGAAEEPK
ncbi:MAG: complex I subunit 5 family protein [Candidatus Methylomirabilales bacterium]